MNKIVVIATLIIIFYSSTVKGQKQERIPDSEIKEIISLAINLPELQQYYHVDTDTTRIPLVIKSFGSVNSENLNGLHKFDKQVLILNESTIKQKEIKAYLNIGDWTYGGNNLRLQMEYIIEGITINIRLNRIDGHWRIVNSLIFEE
jgi:hypothetical protein